MILMMIKNVILMINDNADKLVIILTDLTIKWTVMLMIMGFVYTCIKAKLTV